MIKLGANLRVRFHYLVQKIAKNGKVPLTVVRAGKEMQVELPVSPKHPMVMPDLEGAYPSYFVYGPLVFSERHGAIRQRLAARHRRAPAGSAGCSSLGSPLVKRMGDKPAFEGERTCGGFLAFFPAQTLQGLFRPVSPGGQNRQRHSHQEPEPSGGSPARLPRDEFITIEFDSRDGETLVFPREEMVAATDEILTDNGVRSQGSPDTMAVWNAKPAQ